MKANDLGKLGTGKKRASTSARTSTGSNAGASSSRALSKRLQTDPDDKPWEARLQKGLPKKAVKLIELSDDE
jgi:hypothetical protein